MTSLEQSLKQIIEQHAPQQRAGLLPALLAAQKLQGHLARETVTRIAQGLHVPLAEAYGVVKFYSLLYTQPTGRSFIRVCDDVLCKLAGADKVCADLEAQLGVQFGETTADGQITLETAPCLGACHRAPVALVGERLVEHVDRVALEKLREEPRRKRGRRPLVARPGPHLLHEITVKDLQRLEVAREYGRYVALQKARNLSPAQIIATVKEAGLVGRGGAAFPTGVKWEGAAKEVAARAQRAASLGDVQGYVICNADESETGTFKDRILMEQDPHRLVEALAIAAYAVGVTRGIFYVRGEYPLAYRRLSEAIAEAQAQGLLGDLQIEMRMGAGAYVCGEETALLESIEGKRGEPRVKPPYPVSQGLFGKPTVINNVETLANVPGITLHGADWYRMWGTERSPGTRLVCLSGSVRRPGLYEISMGRPLRDLIFDLGGGLGRGRNLQAILVGGAAGAFLRPDQLDVPMDFQSLTAVGATFGSGAVMVFDDRADLWQVMRGITKFFAHESCGKCFPCQLGTQRQMEMVARISAGDVRAEDRATLQVLGQTMRDASLCGLGQTAASALLSALDRELIRI